MEQNRLEQISNFSYRPLGEVVFEHLRDAIISGKLAPGERLMEIQLAESLGVSRTPVREAMRRLEQEDFIEMIPRKGAYVKDLNAKDILDVLELRSVLEGFAAYQSAINISDHDIAEMEALIAKFEQSIDQRDKMAMVETDNKFHDIIYRVNKNTKLKEIIKSLHEQFHRFRTIYFSEFNDHQMINQGHKDILAALKQRDGDAAQRVTQAHIALVRESVCSWSNKRSEHRRR